MLDSFKQLVAQSSYLTLMVNNVRQLSSDSCEQMAVENVIGYLWDGYIECYIIFDGQHYWDVQDMYELNIPTDWRTKFSKYSSVEEIVRLMEEAGQ